MPNNELTAKTLSLKMIEMLMDCHERELLCQPPSKDYVTQTAKGLLTRGLFRSELVKDLKTGRLYLNFKVTYKGKRYLEEYTNK